MTLCAAITDAPFAPLALSRMTSEPSDDLPTREQTPAGLEIERKFLVLALSDQLKARGAPRRLRQVYLSAGSVTLGRPEVRIRQSTPLGTPFGPEGVRTMKWGRGLSRLERESNASATATAEAFAQHADACIEKVRYHVGGWEVDCYLGALSPLMIAEAELSSADASLPPLPEGLILGEELTGQSRYSNASLAMATPATVQRLQSMLKALGVQDLRLVRRPRLTRAR